jgi:hypothetical protein
MRVTVENNELVIRMPLNPVPTPSATGKTLVVASTHGNKTTDDVMINGKPVNDWTERLHLALTFQLARLHESA